MLKKIGAGKSKTISRSKIKKTTASRKNRKENGSRALPLGSNPHSKGEAFSRSWVIRKEIIQARETNNRVKPKDNKTPKINKVIKMPGKVTIFYTIKVARSSGAASKHNSFKIKLTKYLGVWRYFLSIFSALLYISYPSIGNKLKI